MKPKYCLGALLCLCLMAALCTAQNTYRSSSPFHPLSTGELCPDVPLPLTTGVSKRLSSYAGKPVVLIFMSIYCGTCVAELPQLQALQTTLGDSVTMLLVLSEPRAEVTAFFSANGYAKKSHLPIVTGAAQLAELFPHIIVPHIVWINQRHVVAAISDNRSLTEGNLRLLANGQPLPLRQKKDLLHFDESQPVLTGTPQAGSPNHYSSALSGYIDGAGSSSGIHHDDSLHTRYLCLNVSIPFLYQTISGLPNNLIIPEVLDTGRLRVQHTYDWEMHNLYTYELVTPASLSFAEVQKLQKEDFDRYFGYRSGFERRQMPGWALVRQDSSKTAFPDTVRTFRLSNEDSEWMATHITGAELVNALNNFAPMGGPLFSDETVGGWISLRATVRDITDVPALQKALRQNGLDLVPREQTRDVFVIRDAGEMPALSRTQSQGSSE